VKTAAIYARVSSERQKEEQTIQSQTETLLDYAHHERYVVPQEWIFEDEGYSGSNLMRPGLERIRDLAAEGQLETILVHSPDRLSRKYAYQVLLLEEFSRHGTEVIFLKSVRGNTPEEQLLLQFQGMIAEYERAQIIERSRRGKRHRAQCGSVSVLSGAPYGYQYVKKTDSSCAYYEVIEQESEVVKDIFRYYTQERLSINVIARSLNNMNIPTRSGKCPWERSTVWGMLKNPAYKGLASYGKTERCDRQKITRPLRQKGGYSPKSSTSRQRPKEEWIQIIEESAYSSGTERRKEVLTKELTRLQKGIDKLLDAYQEDLIPLAGLRKRIPVLRRRESAIKKELQGLHIQLTDHRRLLTLTENMESFLRRLRESAETLSIPERQKVVRMVVKEVIVGSNTITIKHSIPIQGFDRTSNTQSYLLRKGSNIATSVKHLFECA
jgi:DNA invertase Pin-like site-specific DNA recombinase